MKSHVHAAPIDRKLLTPGVWVLIGLMLVGFSAMAYRFIFGLGAITNLNDQYPWGIWIGVDVATGVALAAGGFTTAATLAHIFNRRRYHALVRPALLTAMLGYTFVGIGIMFDIGRPYNIWHPLWPTMWQPNSVLFEVALCVVCYLHVLYVEFIPVVCERFIGRVALPGPLAILNKPVDAILRLMDRILEKLMFFFIVAGVVLSCMHQSSLGALLLIAPYKMSPLWYTPVLPVMFLFSAITVGFSMVVFESLLSSRIFNRDPEMAVLRPLSRLILVFLEVYFLAKFTDLLVRDAWTHIFDNTTQSNMFLIEIVMGVLVPLIMLTSARVRNSAFLLLTANGLVVGGVALNRINVFLVAYQPPYATSSYFPSVGEIVITVGLIATLMFLYRVIVTVLPVFPVENASQLAAASIPDRDKILSYANPEKCPYAQPVQSAGSDNLHTVPCRGE